MAKEKLYDEIIKEGTRTRLEEKLKGLEEEYEYHVFDNSHEKGEIQGQKYKYDDNLENYKDNKDYVLLVSKDRSNTILEGTLRLDEDTGKYLFKEAFGGTGEREIEPSKYYDLLGNKVEENSLEPILDKDQIKKEGRLDKALIKTLEVSFGKDVVDKVLDTSDRIYLKESLSEINAKGKIEFMNTIGGLAYLMDSISKSYEVEHNGEKISRGPILSRLYIENLGDTEKAFRMSNLVNHDINTGEKSFKEITDLLMSSQNNPDILYDKVLFLSNAEHYEHSVHSTDSNFIKFFNAMSTRRFDLGNVIVGFVSALIIMNKGFDAKDAFRIAFRMYPPLAGRDQSVGFLITAKGHAERKEIREAINDYRDALDNPEKFVDKRLELLDRRVGSRLEVPDELKTLDKTEPLVAVEKGQNDGTYDVKVGSDVDKSVATVETKVDERDDKDVEVKSVSVETKDKDGKDVEMKVETKEKETETKDKTEKSSKSDKIEKKSSDKVEKKTSKKDKVEKSSKSEKVEKSKGDVKDVVESVKGALEKGDLSKIKDGLEKNGYDIEKVSEKPIESVENNSDEIENRDDKDNDLKDILEAKDIEEALSENTPIEKESDVDDKALENKENDTENNKDDYEEKSHYEREDLEGESEDKDKERDEEEDDNKEEMADDEFYSDVTNPDDLLLDYDY